VTNDDVREANQRVQVERKRLESFYSQVERVLVGQRELVDRIVIALLTGGHLLIEGVPGLAKTLTVRTIARTLHLSFQRIQFTPDLLPADVLGTQIYNPRSGEFTVKPGPVFANLVLADEINRAPAKVQSALLEAMQERQVTIGERSMPLPEPFQVLATQNPIEQEGTYPLPEAQLDRFMFKVPITYPSRDEELVVLDRMAGLNPDLAVDPVLGSDDLTALQRAVDAVYVDAKIKHYVLDLVHATRPPGSAKLELAPLIQWGASPRATLFLIRAAKGQAFLEGRGYVTPDDVKSIAHDVLRHRILVTFEAEAEEVNSDSIVKKVLEHVSVP
jgi:MoxR-like ATPase